jgi:hypothetical protein
MNNRDAIVRTARNFLSVCILFLCASSVALAQAGRGSISGLVSDPSGAIVNGASITALNHATGVALHTVTSAGGLYSFISLTPGTYVVTASQKGFASVAQDNVLVTVDQVSTVNIALQVGTVTQTVTVSTAPELVDTSNSTVGQLIDSATIDRVPLVDRNVFDLVQLSAGVIPVNGSPNSSDSMASIQNISSGRPGVDISADTINGAIVGSVYYMLDGSPIGIAENNSAAIIPAMNIPEDGVEEVRVETQNTSASYQSGAAGVISLVSKSGTNKIHGDVFAIFRPNVLASNDYFNKQSELSSGLANTPPAFHRYQEGAAIGGPIKRNKLFFFADYEDTQQVEFEGIDTFTVPTAAERTGDFSAMGFQIYDPTQPDIACPAGTTGMCRQAFPGNKITNPNPIGLLYLSKMPLCNFPSPSTCNSATTDQTNNFGLPGLDPLNAHRFDVRVDWAKSQRQRLFTRFSYDKLIFSTANVFPSGWDLNHAQNTTNARNIILADDLTLNSTTVLNLRYSFTRHHENQGNPAYSSTDITNLGTVNGAAVGFPASLAAQEVFKQLPFMVFNDLPTPGNGVGGTANYNLFVYASENSDANAAINKVWGKHLIATGFEYMKRYLNVGQPPAPAGAYGFDLSATDQQTTPTSASGIPVGGSDFASILVGMGMSPGNETLLGYPGNFTKDVFLAESNPYYGAFVEDTYHASKILTITAGLRWDIFGGRNERHNRQEYFNPTISNTLNGVSYTGAEVYVNGSNRSPFITNLHNFGPRLAIAWQPITHLVVRGGAGFYYGPSTHNVSNAINTDGFSSGSPWNGTCFNPDGNSVFGLNGAPCPTPAPGVYTGNYSLSNPFPTPPGTPGGIIPVLTTPPTGLANNLGITLSTVLQSQRTPTIYNYNLALEYELPHQVVVTVGYVGSRGLFLPFNNVDLNQLGLPTIARYGSSLCVVPALSCMVPNAGPVSLNPNFSGQATVPQWATVQPFPQFGNGSYSTGNGIVVYGYPAGDSEYSSLQAKVQKRLTGHFTTLSTFTWGKIMTDDGYPPLGFVGSHNPGGPQDWRNLQYEHSISPQDVKFQFTGQVSYDLPVGKGQRVNLHGVSNAFLGGWTTNAIVYLSTGVPIPSPSSGAGPGYFNQRADLICDPSKDFQRTSANWVNNSCFAIPGTENGGNANPLIPGNAPAYLANVRTRGARDLDLSLFKTFPIGESKNLRFDVSAYNVTNWAQYGMPPQQDLTSSVNQPFSAITTNVNTPRQFQFGARFTF